MLCPVISHGPAHPGRTSRRFLVVAGGFLLVGLLHPKMNPPEPKKRPMLTETVHPMRYSMTAADALNGYASGMPAPGFYDALWRALHADAPDRAWNGVLLDHLVRTGRKLRKMGGDHLCIR